MSFVQAYDKWKEAEEAENKVWQRGGYASNAERQAAESEADAAYEAVADAVYGHGGPRPNSGGPRPNSGPLPSRVTLHPFTHRTKGNSHSTVTVHIERCNACGAMGRAVAEAESLFDYDAPTDEGFSGPQPEGIADEPLVHKPGCKFGPA